MSGILKQLTVQWQPLYPGTFLYYISLTLILIFRCHLLPPVSPLLYSVCDSHFVHGIPVPRSLCQIVPYCSRQTSLNNRKRHNQSTVHKNNSNNNFSWMISSYGIDIIKQNSSSYFSNLIPYSIDE